MDKQLCITLEHRSTSKSRANSGDVVDRQRAPGVNGVRRIAVVGMAFVNGIRIGRWPDVIAG